MGKILSDSQCAQIKTIRAKIRKLDTEGWLCEGGDENRLVFFNNETDQYFDSDYYGNILTSNFTVTLALKERAKLEGQIMMIGNDDFSHSL